MQSHALPFFHAHGVLSAVDEVGRGVDDEYEHWFAFLREVTVSRGISGRNGCDTRMHGLHLQ